MKPVTSSRPCIDSAASCSAAIHPSVRLSSAATSSAVSASPMATSRYAAASSAVKRRSAARTSTRSPARPPPRQRQRRVGAAGDHQVDLRGQVLQEERIPSCTSGASMTW
jgi:hypothetical protein